MESSISMSEKSPKKCLHTKMMILTTIRCKGGEITGLADVN